MSSITPNSDEASTSGRSRRLKEDKSGRWAALERLKNLKGTKNKYELKEEAPVYVEVSEKEYTNIVRQRQEEDWIVDDDGGGYVEDGREIFDDDLNDSVPPPTGKKNSSKSYAPPKKGTTAGSSKPKTIKSMFMAPPVKRKPEKDIKIDDDAILGNILEELNNSSPLDTSIMTPKPLLLKRKTTPVSCRSRVPHNPFSTKTSPNTQSSSKFSDFNDFNSESAIRQNSKLASAQESSYKRTVSDGISVSSKVANKIVRPRLLNYELEVPIEDSEGQNSEQLIVDAVEDTPTIDTFDSMDDNICMTGLDDSMDIDDVCSQLIDSMKEGPTTITETVTCKETSVDKMENNLNEIDEDVWIGPSVDQSTKESIQEVHLASADIPVTTDEEGNRVFRFFWLDAFEDYFRHPGVVYLFGKTWIEEANAYVSCCIVVKNIERRVYLLPRVSCVDEATGEEKLVSLKDVYTEFSQNIAEKYKIDEFKSRKVKKRYAFEKTDVPNESEYLEVRYSATLPSLPMDLSGSTFSHAFGTNTSSLEMLLLDCKMKGPCWLDIVNPVSNNPQISWCKVEASVMRSEDIRVVQNGPSPPPLVVMSLELRTVFNQAHQNEIVAISCLTHHKFPLDKQAPHPPFQSHFCALTKPSNSIFPFDFRDRLNTYKNTKVEKMESERALLCFFLAKIHKMDPDVIVGHDICGFDIDALLHRIVTNKVPNWSRLGRLKRSGMPRLLGNKKMLEKNATAGRLICDIKIMAKELIRSKSYDLTALAETVLHAHRKEIANDDIFKMYSSSQQLLQLVDLTMRDGEYILRILCNLNVMPLAFQITCIAGNLMSRTLLGGRSERNEFLLLHAFHERNFICPDKIYGKQAQKAVPVVEDGDEEGSELTAKGKKGRKKPAYTGGLVLEPKKGFYDKCILLMDFNSLYPSIIQEYNICFTTVPRVPANKSDKASDDQDDGILMNLRLPSSDAEPGILPNELHKLVESRRQVKMLLKKPNLSPDLSLQYDIRQKALKLTANSIYGCLGFTNSRFYAKPLAALVTSKGREILMQAKELAQSMGLEVIYGDTDSIMINTNSSDFDDVMKLGVSVKTEVNKLYKLLELDIDGVFKSMLLLKKKKYAALTWTRTPDGKLLTNKEIKGLDIVRRDWSELSKKAGEFVINEILSEKSRDDIMDNIQTYLVSIGKKVREGEIPVEDYSITKQLTKNPEDYPDKKNLPHVQVALRLNSRGGKKLRQGDTISYIVCQDGSNQAATQRAYHIEELKTNETLKIDYVYYLAHQIHPVVMRLCEPIEGMDAAIIAELLGLDPSSYRQTVRNYEDENDALLGGKGEFSDEQRFSKCDKLQLCCPIEQCRAEIIVENVLVQKDDKSYNVSLSCCPNENCKTIFNKPDITAMLCNQIQCTIRTYIRKYYTFWLVCEDVACQFRTRRLPVRFSKAGPICPGCEKACLHSEYSETELYNQLCCFAHLLDLERALNFLPSTISRMQRAAIEEHRNMYSKLKETVDQHIRKSAYAEVDLSNLFSHMYRARTQVGGMACRD